MKKLFVLFAFTMFYLVPFAQKAQDYITMKSDGKVYWIRGGETIQMMIDVPLKNGSVVNYKGEVKSAKGNITKLKKGEKLLMDGSIKKKGKKR